MNEDNNSTDKHEKLILEYFNIYNEYNKITRSWFVAFGIGGPVLFLANATLFKDFMNLPQKGWIVGLFLVGLSAQITIALINKWANWNIYSKLNSGEDMRAINESYWGRLAKMFKIDVGLDLLTMGAFGLAIYLLYQGLVRLNEAIV